MPVGSKRKKAAVEPAVYQGNISAIVRVLMRYHGFNQQQLADRIGVKQNNLSARLRGVIAWTIADLVHMGAVFGVHPAAFLLIDPKDLEPNLAGALAHADALIRAQGTSTYIRLSAPKMVA